MLLLWGTCKYHYNHRNAVCKDSVRSLQDVVPVLNEKKMLSFFWYDIYAIYKS